jgi:hypothetical protein
MKIWQIQFDNPGARIGITDSGVRELFSSDHEFNATMRAGAADGRAESIRREVRLVGRGWAD